jgi:hypothetical protein
MTLAVAEGVMHGHGNPDSTNDYFAAGSPDKIIAA